MSTASCNSKSGEEAAPRHTENNRTRTDARTSHADAHGHKHAETWTLQRLLGARRDRLGFEKVPVIGANIAALKAAFKTKLVKKTSGWVLELPAIGQRPRKTYVLIDPAEDSGRVREYVVLFPISTDSDAVLGAFAAHWGKPKTSKKYKCRLRGCVYRERDPTIVIRQIDTQLMWSIRVR